MNCSYKDKLVYDINQIFYDFFAIFLIPLRETNLRGLQKAMQKTVLQALVALFLILNIGILGSWAQSSELPRVVIVATGGTIAGVASSSTATEYEAGVLSVEQIIATVDGVDEIAQIETKQFLNIASQNLSSIQQLSLASFVAETLCREDVAGVVITHGTDTMEESAYLLSLLVSSSKPVVIVGAMRPSNGLSPDGPSNLYSAVVAAASEESCGRGAMVMMNDDLILGRDVVKFNTLKTDSFKAPNSAPIGSVKGSRVDYLYPASARVCFEAIPAPSEELPKVAILYGHVDSDYRLVDFLVAEGYAGIVFAGVGHGNTNDATLDALARAVESGVVVVRSSRVPTGEVNSFGEVDDAKYGFVSSGKLSPAKARVLLQLSLLEASSDAQAALDAFNSMKF